MSQEAFGLINICVKFYLFCSVEGVEAAIKLVDEILSREGFPAAHVEGQTPPRSVTPAVAVSEDLSEEPVVASDKRTFKVRYCAILD
jgi:hypothetical protein